MERVTAVRKTHTSTADLLTWSEVAPLDSSTVTSGSGNLLGSRAHHPADKISKVLHGVQLTQEEEQSILKKNPCSGYKMREMTGSGIFAGAGGDSALDGASLNNKTSRIQQAANGISQISFSENGSISPKKPTSLPEVAKQRELSGTLQNVSELRNQKQNSDAKFKELSGHDIFSSTPEIARRSLAPAGPCEASKDIAEAGAPRNIRTSVKVSHHAGGQSNILFGDGPVKTVKKIQEQKFAKLSGNNILTGDVPPGSAEKQMSSAKLREMKGSNIFGDGKAESRDYLGGVRKPPGGESSIALI